jgi:hypothetical protein
LFDGKAVESQIPQKRSAPQKQKLRIKQVKENPPKSKDEVESESSGEESSKEVENESSGEESYKEGQNESSEEVVDPNQTTSISNRPQKSNADANANESDSVGAESVEELLNDQAEEIVSKLLGSPKSREFLSALFLKLPLDLKKEMANYE